MYGAVERQVNLGHIVGHFEFPENLNSPDASTPKGHEATCHGHEPEANTGSSRMWGNPSIMR